jgi:hypothetical protein
MQLTFKTYSQKITNKPSGVAELPTHLALKSLKMFWVSTNFLDCIEAK